MSVAIPDGSFISRAAQAKHVVLLGICVCDRAKDNSTYYAEDMR